MKSTILTSLLAAFLSLSARAQLQTIVTTPTSTNSAVITVSSNSFAVIKGTTLYGGMLLVSMQGASFSLDPTAQFLNGVTFTGPATIQLQGDTYGSYFATVDVEPGPFPPGKTFTIAPNTGTVQVTLQTSTDLVNWTTAVSGQSYTNSSGARFFRIQGTTNPGP